jgi:hypothetical protein
VRKPFVYVAGPYTRPDPVRNTHDAIHAGQRVYDAGGFPYVPHLTLLWHAIIPNDDVTYWYDFDLNAIDHADALLRLPGDSTGADNEVNYAEQLGVPVFHDEDVLLDWIRGAVAF